MAAADIAAERVEWMSATDPRWAQWATAHGASLFQSPLWARVLHDTYGFTVDAVVLTDPRGRITAGIPVCRIDDQIGDRIVALPFCDHCDPLVADRAQWQRLLAALAAHGVRITLECRAESVAAADGRLRLVKTARWQGIDIEPDVDGLWSRLAPAARRAIRKAEREGVTVERVDDERFLREFHAMHVALRKGKYRLLAQPVAFFEAICRRFSGDGQWFPLAAYHRGRCIAATMYLAWGDTLYYRFNTSLPQTLPLRPNNLLLWAGIRLAAEQGRRCLDLGRSDLDQPGLIRFKHQFGARSREIRTLRHEPAGYAAARGDRARALLHGVTQRLTDPAVPDEITAAAGAAFYRLFA
jgi:CelD/BcsL family acetyltransferase involved in cellulose biosynthesis